jgi:dienelactone hydrolase
MATKNFIKRIISSPVVQIILIYISGAWIVLEMTDYIINKYNLNEKISDILPVVLLIGLPVTVFIAWILGREKKEDVEVKTGPSSKVKSNRIFKGRLRKSWFSIPLAVIVVLLLGSGIRYIYRHVKIKWAKEQALPEMQNWISDFNYVNAFHLSQQVKKYIPDDPEFMNLDALTTRRVSIISEPEGAAVYYKEYPNVEKEWVMLGTTPLVNIEMPNRTLFRWKFEKEGYDVVYAATPSHLDTLFRTLQLSGTIPEGMIYVEGIYPQTVANFLSQEKNGFYIDRYEVTNQMFKEFMNQGGYENPEFWQHEFILDDETLSFDEAMDHFKDITGRHGPATWEAGDYPDGQDHYPVNGISWYEADAYAAYANKDLPTLLHWQSAAGYLFNRYPQLYGSHVVPLCNMGGSGPDLAGNSPGISYFGNYDMAGNVREWCWNKSPDGRVILGGAWNDARYMSINISQLPAFNRSEKNGFRCAVYPDRNGISAQTFEPVTVQFADQDYRFLEPVSETEFQIYRKQFLYDKTDLASKIEERVESHEDWIIEKITFVAAYENERMTAYLFLPRESGPPYQTMIFFPGSYAIETSDFLEYIKTSMSFDYILKNGRAVMFPIYKTTFERRDESLRCAHSSKSHQYTECMVKCVKDFSRSIDYLETREDIDISKLGYYGDSWGARMGAIIPAVEDRIKLSVLIRGGLSQIKKFPEANEFNYVSWVKTPVLMLNGKYDFIFPYESTVKPMFDLLETPEQNKRLVLYETDHFVPKSEIIKETLDWLDTYFGPVKK